MLIKFALLIQRPHSRIRHSYMLENCVNQFNKGLLKGEIFLSRCGFNCMLSCYFQEEGCRHEWLNMIDRLVSSPRAVDASSAAILLRLLVERCSSPLTFSKHNSVMASSDNEPLECAPCIQTFRVLTYLIDLLRSHCSTASKNLSLIGIQAPMHGVLYCLRSILSYTSLRYSPVAFVFLNA